MDDILDNAHGEVGDDAAHLVLHPMLGGDLDYAGREGIALRVSLFFSLLFAGIHEMKSNNPGPGSSHTDDGYELDYAADVYRLLVAHTVDQWLEGKYTGEFTWPDGLAESITLACHRTDNCKLSDQETKYHL